MMAGSTETEIDYSELVTLKAVALLGSFESETEVASKQLSNRFDVSRQTITRRLQNLDYAGLIDRTRTQNGQQVYLTMEGRKALASEWNEYCRLFGSDDRFTLCGQVTDGLGKGQHFVSLPGYAEQFEEKLNYVPYPGTLNVDLYKRSTARRFLIADSQQIPIDEWKGENQTYGSATCCPVTLEAADRTTYDTAHLLVPDRTDHDSSQLEVIAPDKLRDELDLEENEEVSVHVRR